jgi:hypothetical protein
MRLKAAFSLLLAFALGAILTYGAIRLYPVWRGSQELWGVVVTTFGVGARLYGLFESKDECLTAKTVFVEQYSALAETPVFDKGRLAVVIIDNVRVPVTFSCLPLSDIRGLSLMTGSGG